MLELEIMTTEEDVMKDAMSCGPDCSCDPDEPIYGSDCWP